jgi:hypothetical protein
VAVPCLRRNAFVRNGDAPAGDQLSPGWGVRIRRLGPVRGNLLVCDPRSHKAGPPGPLHGELGQAGQAGDPLRVFPTQRVQDDRSYDGAPIEISMDGKSSSLSG